ncbi:bile acid:sodium symporter family protein [Candidatus Ishikawella capsulata]|nr:bile acid:sodium symporter family protein [Candidatus Ishikawaella capsulata]
MSLLRFESTMIKLFFTILLATLFPAKGHFVVFLNFLTAITISLLFFMHGSRLSRKKLILGSSNWQLHLCILLSTFLLFPILGLLLGWWHPLNIPAEIYTGFIYLCILPATVQSAIAFTSMAGGNVAAAICSASASSFLGIFLSPFLLNLVINIEYGSSNKIEQITKIMLHLLLPFILGHLLRRWTSGWIEKHDYIINEMDKYSILLVVYSAISEAIGNSIWNKLGFQAMLSIITGCMLLLSIVLLINLLVARLLRLDKQDEIVVLFCGSKKSLANGLPMAHLLFPGSIRGMILLPLMIFHQIQLLVCSIIVQIYKNR